MGNDLVKQIAHQIDDVKDCDLFVAVSGGIDSMVLLHALLKLELHPTVLHVNYHLRGAESKGDQQFIEDYCGQHDIPLFVKEIRLAEMLEENGGNLQQSARKVRYDWFHEITGSNKNAIVLLAHHQDDQIETFFLQAFRGSGILGLASMPGVKGKYRRPLLPLSRSEIEAFAMKENIKWREDSSNQSLKYNRNKLRHELIPFMESHIPSLKDDVLSLIAVFQKNYKMIQDKVSSVAQQVLTDEAISIEQIDAFSDEELAELLRQLSLPIQFRSELKKLTNAENNKRVYVSSHLFDSLIKTDHLIRLVRKSIYKNDPRLKIEQVDHLPDEFDKASIYLDVDKIEGELILRRWKESDRIASLGVQGSQLISKILHDSKVLPEERESVFILTDDKNVLWCPGYKIGRTALAEPDSKSILKCTITYKGLEE